MIKLESCGIKEFNLSDAAEVWFNKCSKKAGTPKTTGHYAVSIISTN